ncbi:serine/threonine-protein kinase [Barrientosiimonas humi]|uniref:non-specific serine/threonine protein kinase n=1 Tax=Barrientosiimonas humi TaxID=999931 RepID=A0A542XAZ7_9MICO|nr:serine/threonine-protein kinase [Barrientosiimonas humi]TQL33022.1 serine/threonine-protein kinase [Barrientosiimonas humi]CAG7573012.1 Serine/threonine-protein kinase PknH [Barrientosiimonas humi]
MGEQAQRLAHYRLDRVLGKGGMGSVFVAFDERREREVALKVLPENLADDPVFRDRFRREARIAADLEDPHVVPIHDFGEIDGRLFIDMRLVRGRDLRAIIREDGPLSPELAVSLVDQAGQAVDAAHARGLVHRDVKPANILVTRGDFAYLADFGIASREGETRLTHTGITVGSFTYMAPERFDTRASYDERIDVYALGCVLHEALTGEPPFRGTTLTEQMAAHLHAPRPQPSRSRPDLPPGLDDVVARAMAVDPGDRFATCAELSRAARAALAGGPATSSVRLPRPTQVISPAQPRPARADPAQSRAARPRPAGSHPAGARPATPAPAGPSAPAARAAPAGRRRTNRPVAIALATVLLVVGGWVALTQLQPDRPATLLPDASPTSAAPQTLLDPQEAPAEARSTVVVPAVARYCAPRSDLGGLRVYVAYDEVADPCGWALEVATAVHDNGDRSSPTMSVYSPARGDYATVTCGAGPPIRCRSDGTATAWVVRPDEDVRR